MQRLEEKMKVRQGWALTRSREEVRELEEKVDNLDYEHLLEKEAIILNTKTEGEGFVNAGRREAGQTECTCFGGGGEYEGIGKKVEIGNVGSRQGDGKV